MYHIILDCYTDEPSGLGVPPYLGTYPRYLAGALRKKGISEEEIKYITIDDLRLHVLFKDQKKEGQKTNIKVKNLSVNYPNVAKILEQAEELICVSGIQAPGKYLSALPSTMHELNQVLRDVNCKKILTGPAAGTGTRLEGGKKAETLNTDNFDEINSNYLDIDSYKSIAQSAVAGAFIARQHPDFPKFLMAEIETGRGCLAGKCSFCTEPLKCSIPEFREQKDILAEVSELIKLGISHFRLGKQTCFFSYKNGNPNEIEKLLRPITELKPDVLHIDNVNPIMVNEERTKLVVKYCTEGNVAAFGVESFDQDVIKANHLNTNPDIVLEAVRTINRYGAARGENGMPRFLPGINIIFGLINESKKTQEENMVWLKKILDENLLLRRINIRQVSVFPGTQLDKEAGIKFLRKNKKYYWKWREEIRQKIDLPMLKRLVPEGQILKNLRTEIHDGNTTFCRQLGTYPLIVGVKGKLQLNQFIDVKIKSHMLRSVVGEVLQ